MYSLAQAIGTEEDEKGLMEKVLQLAADAVDADAGYIFIRDLEGRLIPRAMIENREDQGRKISRSIIKRVFKYQKSVLTSDAASDSRFKEQQSVVMKRIQSVICVPLAAFEKINGVLYVHKSSLERSFSEDELEFVTAIGVQTGAALMNLQSAAVQQKMLMGTVKSLITTVELRHPEWSGHSGRVCIWAAAITGELGLPAHENQNVQLAALLHDVGKIVASEQSGILKAGEAYKEEDHVHHGVKIVQNIEGMEEIIPGIRHHHERWDGSGYPEGLQGEAIPMIARIIAVADAFDHLSRTIEGGIKGALVAVGKNQDGVYPDAIVEALLLAYRNGTLFAPGNLLLDQFETTVEDSAVTEK
jgi:putative nucleotidyltransferase with HDIG domain